MLIETTSPFDFSSIQLSANGLMATLVIDGGEFYLPVDHAETVLFHHGSLQIDTHSGTFLFTMDTGIQVILYGYYVMLRVVRGKESVFVLN